MQISAHLDVDVVALQSDDEISLLLELKAPPVADSKPRAPVSLQVVLDRSGSMADGRLYAAQGALHTLVDRLGPEDTFGLVAFDHEVLVAVPAGPLTDKEAVKAAIWSLAPRGMTNLSSGYLRGIQEARRAKNGDRATLVLLSDGHANEGVTDADQLGTVARGAEGRGVVTSTLGVGLGYDETLLTEIARSGSGNALFAEEPDTAGAALAGEVDGLLAQTVQAASVTIRPTVDVSNVTVVNDLPAQPVSDGLMIELGDFYADETRKLLLQFDVPAIAGLGLAQIAEIELQYVELPALTSHTINVPVHVNVVPGDEAAGRIPNPTVTTELAFQRAQQTKRRAAEALRDGHVEDAADLYGAASASLQQILPASAPEMREELLAEAELLEGLASRAHYDDARRLSKFSDADMHRKMRKRGRGPRD